MEKDILAILLESLLMTHEPLQYTARTLPAENPDPFTGLKSREVIGYYVKHLTACPYPISSKFEREEWEKKYTKHYIFTEGFADWGLSQELEQWEIDPETLEEL